MHGACSGQGRRTSAWLGGLDCAGSRESSLFVNNEEADMLPAGV
jgi:hypothetical protein